MKIETKNGDGQYGPPPSGPNERYLEYGEYLYSLNGGYRYTVISTGGGSGTTETKTFLVQTGMIGDDSEEDISEFSLQNFAFDIEEES